MIINLFICYNGYERRHEFYIHLGSLKLGLRPLQDRDSVLGTQVAAILNRLVNMATEESIKADWLKVPITEEVIDELHRMYQAAKRAVQSHSRD
ncbi:MAG TPA: hypothetical protein VM260_05300 [Pirellula sp.]|nr:hypothetical protein [Pirellula sp.]